MLAPRIVVEVDNEGIKDIPTVSFDPNVRDWIKEPVKKDAEVVQLN